tara:strand:+ start:52659 stop:53603 length:945 start_codon:yes stop_codon:yes gene_type:complete
MDNSNFRWIGIGHRLSFQNDLGVKVQPFPEKQICIEHVQQAQEKENDSAFSGWTAIEARETEQVMFGPSQEEETAWEEDLNKTCTDLKEPAFAEWVWRKVPCALDSLNKEFSWEKVFYCNVFFGRAMSLSESYPHFVTMNPFVDLCGLVNVHAQKKEEIKYAETLACKLVAISACSGAQALDQLARIVADKAKSMEDYKRAFLLFDLAHNYYESISTDTLLHICYRMADHANTIAQWKKIETFAQALGNEVNNACRGEALIYLVRHMLPLLTQDSERQYAYSLLAQIDHVNLIKEKEELTLALKAKKFGFCVLI